MQMGEIPTAWKQAHGANIVDADDNLYIDMTARFCIGIAGHCHMEIGEKARALITGEAIIGGFLFASAGIRRLFHMRQARMPEVALEGRTQRRPMLFLDQQMRGGGATLSKDAYDPDEYFWWKIPNLIPLDTRWSIKLVILVSAIFSLSCFGILMDTVFPSCVDEGCVILRSLFYWNWVNTVIYIGVGLMSFIVS